MKQQPFETRLAPVWQEFDELVHDLDQAEVARAYALPGLYRRICHHYALARTRYYSPHLIGRLQSRIRIGHQLLYRQKSFWFWQVLRYLALDFPVAVRASYRYFWLSCLLFVAPALAMGIAAWADPELIYSVMAPEAVAGLEGSYDPDNRRIGRSGERSSDSDFMMFGFYIYNNISIGFRCFASGILFGVGTVITLVSNGIQIGGSAGHVTGLGFESTFWPFVSGHGALELTAIVICGAAGLRLARPVIAPGRHTRLDALRIAGRESVQLVMGAAFMLTIAAFIEAFWSASTWITIPLKLVVAAILWTLVTAWLLRAGRS